MPFNYTSETGIEFNPALPFIYLPENDWDKMASIINVKLAATAGLRNSCDHYRGECKIASSCEQI